MAEPLEPYVPDPTLRAALEDFGQQCHREISVPPQTRLDRGYGGATLFVARLTEPVPPGRTLTRKVFVKVLPARSRNREVRGQHRARAAPGDFARRHLAEQIFPPIDLRDGRRLMFEETTTGGARVRALDELDGDDLLAAFRAVLEAVLHEWNGVEPTPGRTHPPTRATALGPYLERELRAAGTWEKVHDAMSIFGFHSDAESLLIDSRPLPNPLRALDPASPYHRQPIDFHPGFAHGDLHGGNVLVPCGADGRPYPERFSLVGLSAIDAEAPLTRDLAALLLATVLRYVPSLTRGESEALITYLVHPQRGRPGTLPGPVAELVRIADEVGTAYARPPGGTPTWRRQARLSLIAQALTCTTFEDLRPDRGLWCLRLAARAMQAHLDEHPLPSAAVPAPPTAVGRWPVSPPAIPRRETGTAHPRQRSDADPPDAGPVAPPVVTARRVGARGRSPRRMLLWCVLAAALLAAVGIAVWVLDPLATPPRRAGNQPANTGLASFAKRCW
ncbi:hypothetical protein E1258_28340 [Micromonospora sp. KC207]|uniref:hypothetical protein n=1 Tax=Micromonospora sp. KC207 TaxID=2530377 RepID=UPI00104E83D2|nr:hypothetical protein [Micromonospora sp. KC207]TDC47823.1 hypothetical protein E1258_28340 [Micromonospora sp. KC207]